MPRTPKEPTTKKAATKAPRPKRTVVKKAEVIIQRPKVAKNVKRTYLYAVGRRKEAVARVRLHLGSTEPIMINGRPIEHYFPTPELQQIVRQPLVLTEHLEKASVTAKVSGGGTQGQAESVRLGVARALVQLDPDYRLTLKRAGFLRRDPRVKERKKYGLKRARRAPQWQKR